MYATIVALFLLFLLTTLSSTLALEADLAAPSHRCIHPHSQTLQNTARSAVALDVDYGAAPRSSKVQETLQAVSRAVSGLAADAPVNGADEATAVSAAVSRPLRLHFDVSHLYDAAHICTAVGQLRGDKLGGNVTCGEDDLAHAWKRDFVVHRVLPLLGDSVRQWLSLRDDSTEDREAKFQEKTPENANKAKASRIIVPHGICGPNVAIPASHSTKGVVDADFVVYVLAAPLHDAVTTVNPRASASTSSRTVAWATYCAVERPTGRPLIAMMNFVPSSFTIRDVSSYTTARDAAQPRWQRALRHAWRTLFPFGAARSGAEAMRLGAAVARANEVLEAYVGQWTAQHGRSLLHELLHALGFAPKQLLRHSTKVTLAPAASPSLKSAVYVTAPAVSAAVQRWMNCSKSAVLPGAALEQSGPSGTAGAHWERLYFHDDLMAGVLSPNAALSDMTMAFFDSLPYYGANRAYAEHAAWGHVAGCAFAAGFCTPVRRFAAFDERGNATNKDAGVWRTADADDTSRLRYWCEAKAATAPGHTQCTADRRAIGFCYAQRGARVSQSRAGAAKELQPYSLPGPAVTSHGLSMLMEGCPIVEPYANRMCDTALTGEGYVGGESSAGSNYQRGVLVEDQGFYFGPYSRCFPSSDIRRLDSAAVLTPGQRLSPLAHAGGSGGGGAASTSASHTLVSSRCLQTRCVRGGAAVELRVGSEWIACPADGTAGVVAVPPTSGYAGWVGCEAAAMYCAGSMQLQAPPLQLRSTAKPARTLARLTPPLPLYRVTVTFAVSLGVSAFTQPFVGASGFISSACVGNRAIANTTLAAAGALALRASLVNSDRAFQAALQRDLAHHRAGRGLSPLGAVMEQRVVGATRLTSAAFAVFTRTAPTVTPLRWDALISANVEVVAGSGEEALSQTRAWLTASQNDGGSGARLSLKAFPSTETWLSQSSCAAATTLARLRQHMEINGTRPLRGIGKQPADAHVPPLDAEAGASVTTACAARGVASPPSAEWNVSSRGSRVSLTVVGPLDVSEQGGSSSDLREVAHLHLRLHVRPTRAGGDGRLRNGDSGDAASTARQGSTSAATVGEPWLTHAATLLALAKDVSALLGVSASWVRVAALRHASGDAAVSTASHHTLDVSFVVSLPALEELPVWFVASAGAAESEENSGSTVDPSAAPPTWTFFTERVRNAWYAEAGAAVESAPVGCLLCPLRHTSAFYRESVPLSSGVGAADEGTGLTTTSAPLCPVVLDVVVSVHPPQPGTPPGEFVAPVGTGTVLRWWGRRVLAVGGYAVNVAALVLSVVAATVLLLCACRYGCF